MDIVSVAQMRDIERAADAAGLSYGQMMHRAGMYAAAVIHRRMAGWCAAESDRPVHVLILAGPGNNGGDGLVCADELHRLCAAEPDGAGCTVQVYLLKPRPEDDAVFEPLRAAGVFVADAVSDMRLRVLRQLVNHADIIVDALLGTGVSRPIEGALRDMLGILRAAAEGASRRRPVIVALDGMTGMNYDTGALDGAAVPADLTIAFHAPKRGHYCFPAAGEGGELIVAPIGIDELPGDVRKQVMAIPPAEQVSLVDAMLLRQALPRRQADANKGSSGKVLVIGGCSNYPGAPALAANAAYRAGAGLVTLAVPQAVQPSAAVLCRESTFVTLDGSVDSLSVASLQRLESAVAGLDRRHAIVLGPGMGQAPAARDFLVTLLAALGRNTEHIRLVVDADALNHLAMLPDWHRLLPDDSILTPHPGEMARLTGASINDIQSDRIGHALHDAHQWGHTVVLKGANTVIAHPEQGAGVLPHANPALAVAGTGDVLAGAIGGMLAQGLEPFAAAYCGASLHALAGELWRKQHGTAGMLAGDLLSLLPDVLNSALHNELVSGSRNTALG